MNTKWVESLADAIAALPPEDYTLFQETLITKTIQKSQGVCGGQARIRNTRIPVWTITSLQQQGADEAEILHNFPGLTRFDLLAANHYYHTHSTEIEDLIQSHNQEDESGL